VLQVRVMPRCWLLCSHYVAFGYSFADICAAAVAAACAAAGVRDASLLAG
jgi:hypothetical protein